jgi:hypothetical protein
MQVYPLLSDSRRGRSSGYVSILDVTCSSTLELRKAFDFLAVEKDRGSDGYDYTSLSWPDFRGNYPAVGDRGVF